MLVSVVEWTEQQQWKQKAMLTLGAVAADGLAAVAALVHAAAAAAASDALCSQHCNCLHDRHHHKLRQQL